MNYLLNFILEISNKLNLQTDIVIIFFSIIPFSIVMAALILTVLLLVYAERKILAYFTQRKGPNRVGLNGIFQTTADAIKLLCKENIELICSDKFLFTISPILAFSSIVILWCIMPYSSEFHMIDSSISLLFFITVGTYPMIFHFLAGYASNNKYSLLGAYRGLSLFIAYTIPITFTILSVIYLAQSMDIHQIILAQNKYWLIFPNFIGFLIFFISSVAELNRTPFDLSESESELVSGYNVEYSGMRFAMFFLGEYANLFISSVLITSLFLGGYLPPFGIYLSDIILANCDCLKFLLYFEQIFWLIIKSSILIFIIIWIRATLPRLTKTDVLNLFWKYLIPISIINLAIILLIGRI